MPNNKKKILVMGVNGMLGSMLYKYFTAHSGHDVFGTYFGINPFPENPVKLLHFDASYNVSHQLAAIAELIHPDYILNCIGIIKPWCRDDNPAGVKNAIKVNALFPHELANEALNINPDIRIISIATDCVFSGRKGNYNETDPHDPLDVYGKTKSLGEVSSPNFLNIRTSILGPELTGKKSLLEWFLSNPDGSKVKGYIHHRWNGITTLQFAQLCDKIMSAGLFDEWRSLSHVIHWVENESVNKYELLKIFNKVYERNIEIISDDNAGEPIDRTLDSVILPVQRKSMIQALIDLRSNSIPT